MKENEIQVLGHNPEKEQKRRFWIWSAIVAVVMLAVGCLIGKFAFRESQTGNLHPYGECTIDSALQLIVDTLLREKMTEIAAQSGQAIVMEVASGEIRAMVGLQKRFDGELEPCQNFGHRQESTLMRTVTLLALLETGEYDLSTIVDGMNGVSQIGGISIKDHNWYKGGYGILTIEQALEVASNIGLCVPTWDYYKDNPNAYYEKLRMMSYGKPDSIEGIPEISPIAYLSPEDSIWKRTDMIYQFYGYYQEIAPIQMLTFYNAIANGGRMVEPMLYRRDTVVINPHIASESAILQMQSALRHVVTEGLGRKAETKVVEVSGLMGDATVSQGSTGLVEEYNDKEYHMEFCGYFPARNPRYSIIVSLNKIGIPASGGGMAGPVFRQIVERMCERGM